MSAVFYYDIVCPFAYCASHLVEAMARRNGARILWRPVLLGGLYSNTKAPQGKEGSATDVMAPSKLKLANEDLAQTLSRNGVPINPPSHHPQRTVTAMRVLAGIQDDQLRVTMSKAFYKAYWQEGRNMEDASVLQTVADSCDTGLNIEECATGSQLRQNTQEASDRGAFGVPAFYVNNELFWGVDRMFMVEQMLGNKSARPDRLVSPPSQGRDAVLRFLFDYSSPWSYLGCVRLRSVIEEVLPVRVKIEYFPILVGALFKKIGTPMLPMQAMAPAKQQYGVQDLQRWAKVANTSLRWPEFFPLNSVLPLRVTLAADCNERLINILYKAVWQDNRNIGSPEVLTDVLEEAGYPAQALLDKAVTQPIKSKLFENTEWAVKYGACGVPSFVVNDGPLIWGQDKLNVVQDMLCGWEQTDHTSRL